MVVIQLLLRYVLYVFPGVKLCLNVALYVAGVILLYPVSHPSCNLSVCIYAYIICPMVVLCTVVVIVSDYQCSLACNTVQCYIVSLTAECGQLWWA